MKETVQTNLHPHRLKNTNRDSCTDSNNATWTIPHFADSCTDFTDSCTDFADSYAVFVNSCTDFADSSTDFTDSCTDFAD